MMPAYKHACLLATGDRTHEEEIQDRKEELLDVSVIPWVSRQGQIQVRNSQGQLQTLSCSSSSSAGGHVVVSDEGFTKFENVRWEGAHPDACKPLDNKFTCEACNEDYPKQEFAAYCDRQGQFSKTLDPLLYKALAEA